VIAPVAIVTPLTPTAAGNKRTASAAEGVPEIQRLTAAMASGDETAFREFHSAYFDRLLRYLFVVERGDEEAARDALQETFTRVARHVRSFDSEEKFWSWLTLLARSAATDGHRKRHRYWNLLSRFALLGCTQEDANPVEETRLDALLADAIAALEPTGRALIEQKYFGQMSVRDLAHRFQLTEKAVESRLRRARHELRLELVKRLKNENAER
jgi:RNA polymerase sigma factor (sigma-70 family)